MSNNTENKLEYIEIEGFDGSEETYFLDVQDGVDMVAKGVLPPEAEENMKQLEASSISVDDYEYKPAQGNAPEYWQAKIQRDDITLGATFISPELRISELFNVHTGIWNPQKRPSLKAVFPVYKEEDKAARMEPNVARFRTITNWALCQGIMQMLDHPEQVGEDKPKMVKAWAKTAEEMRAELTNEETGEVELTNERITSALEVAETAGHQFNVALWEGISKKDNKTPFRSVYGKLSNFENDDGSVNQTPFILATDEDRGACMPWEDLYSLKDEYDAKEKKTVQKVSTKSAWGYIIFQLHDVYRPAAGKILVRIHAKAVVITRPPGSGGQIRGLNMLVKMGTSNPDARKNGSKKLMELMAKREQGKMPAIKAKGETPEDDEDDEEPVPKKKPAKKVAKKPAREPEPIDEDEGDYEEEPEPVPKKKPAKKTKKPEPEPEEEGDYDEEPEPEEPKPRRTGGLSRLRSKATKKTDEEE